MQITIYFHTLTCIISFLCIRIRFWQKRHFNSYSVLAKTTFQLVVSVTGKISFYVKLIRNLLNAPMFPSGNSSFASRSAIKGTVQLDLLAVSSINRQVTLKGRGAEIFSCFTHLLSYERLLGINKIIAMSDINIHCAIFI
jgi:hypothetical protein